MKACRRAWICNRSFIINVHKHVVHKVFATDPQTRLEIVVACDDMRKAWAGA
jgi:hypothetical protein